jgi:hypothetical protein
LQWRLHEELFVNEERRKLLDEVAGMFFGLAQCNFFRLRAAPRRSSRSG